VPKKTRILIVDDDRTVASLLEEGLRAGGFRTSVAPDGESALVHVENEDIDLILLDLALPGRPGIEVLSELRARGRRVPIVILTAFDTIEDKVQGLEAGANDYIAKPFDLDEVIARIRARLREHRRRQGGAGEPPEG
jgi:DNA-binding response OmpR family regulator